jgi:hypothetical protein
MSRLTAPRNQKMGRLRGASRGRFATSATNGIPTRRMSAGRNIQRRNPRSGGRRKRGGAKQAYAAGAEPSAPESEAEWSPYMAWGASVQPGGGALDAFAIYTKDGPELRATTMEQQDTTPAARAKGEAARTAARAKEEKGRVSGPPPGFKSKGERAAPAAEEAGQPGPAGRRRQAPEAAAAAPARATRIPPGFGEHGPNDPWYRGLTDAEQVGVRVELLDPPRCGPVTGDVVRRRAAGPDGSLPAFHADVLPAEEAEAAGGATRGHWWRARQRPAIRGDGRGAGA